MLRLARASGIGGQAPFMSPVRASPGLLLYFTAPVPRRPRHHHRGPHVARHGGAGSGRWGVLRSEV